jgi:hypothetical protein
MSEGGSRDVATGKTRKWKRFRCADAACAGVKTFVLQHTDGSLPARQRTEGAVTTALYGARLGLRFALDRTAEQWKTQFLFFRLGGLTLEVIHRLGETHNPAARDTVWGLTWTVADLAAAHQRLIQAGLTVSDVRKGRKPGSTVFTVKEGTLGIPTLFIAHEGG